MSRKTITVVGATGNQGRSAVSTFLAHPDKWHVRAITRDSKTPKAQALAALGAELVVADLLEPSTLPAAFAGSHAIFLNTDYWTHYYPLQAKLLAENTPDPSRVSAESYAFETTCGKNAARAAAQVPTLERLVLSTLYSASKASGGRFPHALHLEAKAEITRYILEEQAELGKKTSLLILGAYATNRFFTPTHDPSTNTYRFVLPMRLDTVLPIIDPTTSTGPFVHSLIEHNPPGTRLLAYDSKLTIKEVLAAWSQASGREASFMPVSAEWLEKNMGMGREHLDAVEQMVEQGYAAGVEGLIEPSQLNEAPVTRSWEEWLKERDWDEVLKV